MESSKKGNTHQNGTKEQMSEIGKEMNKIEKNETRNKTNETCKKTSESRGETNETRKETFKKTNETGKETNETHKKTNETPMKTNETQMKTNEISKGTNETDKEINETLQASRNYLHLLEKLDDKLQSAQQQIASTTTQSQKDIEDTFAALSEKLLRSLSERKAQLLEKVQRIRTEGLEPLNDSRSIISDKMRDTSALINLGNKLVNGVTKQEIAEFTNRSRFLGSLPEVPALKDVPCVSFNCEPNLEAELLDLCSGYGSVSRIAPMQFSSAVEKPGGVLLKWKYVDLEERACDIQEFRLQKAFGDVNECGNVLFSDCYLGTENQFLVRDLQTHQNYSFRVCCKYEGSNLWSDWSVPRVTQTTIEKFRWRDTAHFNLNNNNTIAKPTSDHFRVLFSDGPQFQVRHSVEFTILEASTDQKNVCIGLSLTDDITESTLFSDNLFGLEANGSVYVNGDKKSTQLPCLVQGSKICFTCDLVGRNKVRINMDSNDKRVTYDLQIDSEERLFFFAAFNSSKWKIMVE